MNDIPDNDDALDPPHRPFWNKWRVVRLSIIALIVFVVIAVGAPRPGGNTTMTFSKIGSAVGHSPAGTTKSP